MQKIIQNLQRQKSDMVLSTEYKIKIFLIFNHVAFAIGLFYASPYWLLLTVLGWILINRIGGEIGLHNNHHAAPMNYSNKVKKYEFDFPARIIKNF